MAKIPIEIIKGVEAIPIGLLCPECDGKLYASMENVRRAANLPAFCDSCNYTGFKHGGFDGPTVEQYLNALGGGGIE